MDPGPATLYERGFRLPEVGKVGFGFTTRPSQLRR